MDNLAKFLGVNRSEMQHVFDMGQWTPVTMAKSSLHKNSTGLHLSNSKRTIPNYIRLNSSGELSSDEDCEVVCSNQNNQGIQSPIYSFTEAEFNGMGEFPEHDIRNMSCVRSEAHNNVQGEGPRRSDPRTCTLPCHITNMAHNQSQSRMFSKPGTLDKGYTMNNRHAGPWKSFTAQQGHATGFGKSGDDGVYFHSPLYCGPNPGQSWQLRTASQWQGMYPHTHQLAPQQTHFMPVNSVPACRRVQMANGQSGPGVYYNMPVYNIVAGMMPVWFGTAWGPTPCVLQPPQQPPCPAPSGGQNTYNQTFMRPQRKYAKPCSKFPRRSPCKDTRVDLQATPIHQTRPVVQHIEKADSLLPPSNSDDRSKLHCPDHSEKVAISSCEVEKLANDLDLLVLSNPPSSDCGKADLENDPKPELCDNVQSVISEATPQRQQEITEKVAIVNLKMDILTADDEGISAGNSCALSQSENTMNPSKDSKSQGSGEAPKQGGAACPSQPCRIILSSLPNLVHRKKKKVPTATLR